MYSPSEVAPDTVLVRNKFIVTHTSVMWARVKFDSAAE